MKSIPPASNWALSKQRVVYCSLDDLAALARFALGEPPQLLEARTFRHALRDDPLPGGHGVAWLVGERDGHGFVGHTGSTADYSEEPHGGIRRSELATGR